jgi:hypothetical protein
MKPRIKFLLSITIMGGLCGGAVVHTTSFPKRGATGVPVRATPELEELGERLREHMRYQTVGIGQRQAARDGASWALVEFITNTCRDAGFEPEIQEYTAGDRPHQNIIAEKPGRGREILLIGAHYDAYGRSPSAAASASGPAALLEVMRRIADTPTDRTLRFAFFSTGEAPYRATEDMGSRQYAKLCKERNDPLTDVLILDSFAHFSSLTGTQSFYFPWNLVFPSSGDFVCVVGDIGQRSTVERTLSAWSRASEVPARGLAIASWLARIRGGDQDAFTAEGYSAVLVTDTGVNRFEDIRSRSDTFDRVDYIGFASAVEALGSTVLELAGR